MKASFDFDSTLDIPSVQKFAKKLVRKGIEVWIVTSRVSERFGNPNWNFDLFRVAREVGIKEENIHFTEGDDKWKFLKDKGFLFHLDDDCIELELLEENTKVVPISHLNCRSDFGGKSWKQKCLDIIREKN